MTALRVARRAVVLAALVLGLLAGAAHATALAPFIDLEEPGLALASDSAGLRGLGDGVATLRINKPANVRFAVLYWSGQDRPCPMAHGSCVFSSLPYKDQQVVFAGKPITGTVIGTETQPASADGTPNNIAYTADVTNLVIAAAAGPQSFTFADGNRASNLARLDGVSLLVAYQEPDVTATRRLLLFDGLDFALGNDATAGASRETAPVVLNHGSRAFARTAQLSVVAGGASAEASDEISISGNPSVRDCLDGSSGAAWDHDSVPVTIPAGTGATTVQAMSPAAAARPDHLNWVALAMLVAPGGSLAAEDDCFVPPAPAPPAQPPEPAHSSPPPAGPAVDAAPVVSALALSPSVFRGARRGRSAAAGSRVRYSLSEASRVRFAVEHARPGRRAGGRCEKPQAGNRGRPGCTRFVCRRGDFGGPGNAGANGVRFRGRLRGSILAPGRYRLRAVAVDAAGNRSLPARARFRIRP